MEFFCSLNSLYHLTIDCTSALGYPIYIIFINFSKDNAIYFAKCNSNIECNIFCFKFAIKYPITEEVKIKLKCVQSR